MRANDNGEGETFSLYSLLCHHAKVNTIPNQHRKDKELTAYRQYEIEGKSVAARTKQRLEEKSYRQKELLILVLLGTCMVIGDGILTPAISGLHTSQFSQYVLVHTSFLFGSAPVSDYLC